LWYVKRVFK
jgi:hypothetical protein